MRLENRLARLEAPRAADRRCSQCWDRPAQVLWGYPAEAPAADPPADAWPCSACGWQPDVIEVVEVIVTSREEMEQFHRDRGPDGSR